MKTMNLSTPTTMTLCVALYKKAKREDAVQPSTNLINIPFQMKSLILFQKNQTLTLIYARLHINILNLQINKEKNWKKDMVHNLENIEITIKRYRKIC